jgi:hypothetical protein
MAGFALPPEVGRAKVHVRALIASSCRLFAEFPSLPFVVFLHLSVGVGASRDEDRFSSRENTSDNTAL